MKHVRILAPLALALCCSAAQAGPILQLYIEGATYDSVTESWIIAPPGSSAGEPFRLWAIGNTGGPGGKGTIENVRLSAAYSGDAGPVQITLTPSTTGGFGGYTDPSLAEEAVFLQTVTDGSSPILGDGSSLPAHGVYGPGVHWQEFGLGDFTLEDSPYGDFIDEFPTPSHPETTQISVYEISVIKGASEPLEVHFDLYDTITAGNHVKVRFAPFSHDADATATIVPEPATLLVWSLLGLSLSGGAGLRRGRKRPRGGRDADAVK